MDKQPQLSAERQKLLAQRLKGAARTAVESRPRSRPARRGPVPLSFAQHQMWLIEQMTPGNPAYNIPVAYRISGELDIRALEVSFNKIIERHEVWRTTFQEQAGDAVQEVHSEGKIQLRTTSLDHLPAGERESEVRALASQEAVRPFDLRRLPLLRVSLFKLDQKDHVLLVVLHHIIGDGLSLTLMFDELDASYRAVTTATTPQVPELVMQYADFAVWQKEDLAQNRHADQLEYWQRQLKGDLPVLELATDRPRPLTQSFAGSTVAFALPQSLVQALTLIGTQESCTFFVTILAAFQILLLRSSRAEEILIGTPVADRPLQEVDRLIGNFINIVALRCDVSGNPAFSELLRRSRETALQALSNKDIPFELVVKDLQSHRDPSRNPVFQVLLQILPAVRAKIGELAISAFEFQLPFTQVDIALNLYEEPGGGFLGRFQYCTDLFAAKTVERLAQNFVQLLQEIVANPLQKILEIPILAAGEKDQLLREWNQTKVEFPSESTLPALFEKQASRAPESVAVEFGDQHLTYRELDRRANQVARHLCTLGVGRGACVGVCLERSVELVVSLLAILKTGAAYVPLDTASPSERLASMLAESGCSAVLTRADKFDLLRTTGVAVIDFDAVDFSQYDAHGLGVEGGGGDRAYVIFTSGSTGPPKGVAVPHRAIARLVTNTDYAQLTADDVVAHVSNVAFDAATFELWGALLNGAKLVVVPRDVLLSSSDFAAFLSEHGVTTLFLTTALFNQIARQNPATFRSLKHLLFGGEASNPDCVRRVLAQGAPERLVHVYGPTEATTFASWQLVRDVPAEAVTVPLGQPIANTTMHLLDSRLQLVPCGAIGEIFIGGPGLALGYLNDAVLTAERFLETPFGRLYRTGDLARRCADGALEFRGRVDSQVKLRGFRIEPGEIETALQQHPLIQQAAVVAHTAADAAHSLIAYLVPQSGERVDLPALREFLAHRLPAYMIPSAFLWLESLPLTRNGKLDVRKLPAPAAATEPLASESGAPRNEIERGITALWIEELGRNHLALDDDFFLVGGHSILAIRMLSRMREKFQVDVPVQRLFETPTIRGLAEFVAERLPAPEPGHYPNIVMIQRGDPARAPVFLVPGGWGGEIEFLVYGQLARQLDPKLPIYGLCARDAQTNALPNQTVEQMAAGFIADLCAFQPAGPYLIGGECVGGVVAYEMVRQLEAAGREVALLLLLDTDWPTPKSLVKFEAWDRQRRRTQFWETRISQPLRSHWKNLSQLPLPAKWRYLWKRLRRGAVPSRNVSAGLEREVLTEYPRRLMAHTPRPHPAKVTLVINEEAHARFGNLGWSTRHPGELEIHIVPGDHVSYIREHAVATAATLREIIDRTCQSLSC